MKKTRAVLALAVILAGAFATESAFAWHRARVGVGFYFGVPLGGYYYAPPYYPYYYPPYPYYPPAAVVMPSQPQTYVEQGGAPHAAPAPQQPQGYWYYCQDSRAYYPYVKDCPAGWQRVSPQPSN
jgi:hypothetical protein